MTTTKRTQTPSLDYWIHDADQHYYEPDDCYSRHIEERFKKKTMWIDRSNPDTPGRMYVGDERCQFFSVGAGAQYWRARHDEGISAGGDGRRR
jgi:hypothetical protein